MLAIVDYGVGNLFSLQHSFKAIGADAIVSSDANVIRSADRILLPGVGAFQDAAAKLRETGLDEVVISEAKKGKPLMGICLGMQMLFDKSYEYGEHAGLGLIPGCVSPIAGRIPEDYKIPHIGWNALKFTKDSPLFKYIEAGDHVYFVHSYHAEQCEDAVIAVSEYGYDLTAAVAKDNVFGCQFHPEKSGKTGLNILRAFCEMEG